MGRLNRFAALLVLAGSSFVGGPVGCGGAAGAGTLEGTTVAEEVDAPAPGVDRYRTASSEDAVLGGDAAGAVVEGIEDAADAFEVEVEGDGRLGLLAAWIAERLGEGGRPPPHDVVEFFARHLGLVEPVPHLLILGQPDASTLRAGVRDSVGQFLARHPYNRYGATVVDRQGLTLAVITLSSRWVELTPIPRELPTGAEIALEGRLLGSHIRPVVAIADPAGAVQRRAVGDGPRFDVRVPTDGPGVYKVELLAQGPRGDTVLANFPVYVGVEPPESVVLHGAEDEAEGDAGSVARELFRLLNRSRSQAGLPPLELHDGLGEVAEAHSRDMVDAGYVGHESPTTGSAPDRIRRAGYRSGLILENIGRGYSASEIHRGLLESPGHRANILNPDVTHVGVGVVAEPEGQRTAFVATQVFLRMQGEVDLSNAAETLLERINRARRARGAEPLELDPNLSEAAAEAAARYFAEPDLSQQDVVDDASGGLRRFAIAYSRVGGLMAVVGDLEEAARLEPTFDPEARYVGIGAAQGTRPDTEPNAIAVVIVLAWPR